MSTRKNLVKSICSARFTRTRGAGLVLATALWFAGAADAEILSESTNELVGFSCAQWKDWNAHKTPQSRHVSQCWDFETGEIGDAYWGYWTVVNPANWTAFNNQPTFGDNVRASRVHQNGDIRQQLNGIGGDYWNVPAPIGHQGNYWLGTFENRPGPGDSWGGTQGDHPIGKIWSPAFVIDRNYITFLIGGDCSHGFIGLQIYDKATKKWQWAVSSRGGQLIARSRTCSERLERVVFDTTYASGLHGRTARIEIRDNWRGGWGHLNVDHIVHTDLYPTRVGAEDQPVWGWADTHAHVGNHLGFRSSMLSPSDGYMFHGDPEVTMPCDGNGHRTDHQGGPGLLSRLEGASFGEDIAAHTDAGRYLTDWPYWFTRGHQQMSLPFMRRAYEGGQRLMVAAAGNGEIIGAFMRENHGHGYVSDFGAMRRFAVYMKSLVSRHDWMEIALTPEEAIEIIRANKLAVVLATEVDDIGDRCNGQLLLDSPFIPEDLNFTTSTSGSGSNPWNQIKDGGIADSCSSSEEWKARIEDLYELGYRVITPVHLTDNGLGGAAVYSDLFNVMQRFNRGNYFEVETTSNYAFNLSVSTYEMGWCAGPPCAAAVGQGGILLTPFIVATLDAYTPVSIGRTKLYPMPAEGGHQNVRGLTSHGQTVLQEMMRRGMLIDVSHMGRKTRDRVLGVGAYATNSIVNPDCNMSSYNCQVSAYPVIASHSGFQPLTWDGKGDESSLTQAHLTRILRGGGTIAVGTADADVPSTDDAFGTGSSLSIEQQYVTNDCGGSSRSFAQSYLFALRQLRDTGRTAGMTLGTDFNGLQSQLNPRFGPLGCYARGNVPQVFAYGHTGDRIITDDVNRKTPLRYDRQKLLDHSATNPGTAGGQRVLQRSSAAGGLNYAHYAGVPPRRSAENGYNSHFGLILDPPDYVDDVLNGRWPEPILFIQSTSMNNVSSLPPMNASTTQGRTFDLNYDGLAHYGMLPDMLQDARTVGMTREQLGPLFQGAHEFIKTWLKACSMADSGSTSALGCQ